MSTHSKFRVYNLYINYKFTKEQDQNDARSSLIKALRSLFGDGYDTSCMPVMVKVPVGSNFIEIDETLTQEFERYPALKGMRFQLQVCRYMLTV